MDRFSNFHVLLLKNRLLKKQQQNSRFSLRNFARILDISPTALSQVIGQKKGMSESVAVKIADKLNLTNDERQLFLLSVSAAHSRNLKNKLKSSIELAKIAKKSSPVKKSRNNKNQIISDAGPFHVETLEVQALINSSDVHKTYRYKSNAKELYYRILHILKDKQSGQILKDFIQITFNEKERTAATVYFIQKENGKFKTYFNNVFDGNHQVTSLIEANQNSTVLFNHDHLPVIPQIHFVYLNSNKHVIGKMEYTKKCFVVSGTLIDFDEDLNQTNESYHQEVPRSDLDLDITSSIHPRKTHLSLK